MGPCRVSERAHRDARYSQVRNAEMSRNPRLRRDTAAPDSRPQWHPECHPLRTPDAHCPPFSKAYNHWVVVRPVARRAVRGRQMTYAHTPGGKGPGVWASNEQYGSPRQQGCPCCLDSTDCRFWAQKWWWSAAWRMFYCCSYMVYLDSPEHSGKMRAANSPRRLTRDGPYRDTCP